jgi:hypothetical protein
MSRQRHAMPPSRPRSWHYRRAAPCSACRPARSVGKPISARPGSPGSVVDGHLRLKAARKQQAELEFAEPGELGGRSRARSGRRVRSAKGSRKRRRRLFYRVHLIGANRATVVARTEGCSRYLPGRFRRDGASYAEVMGGRRSPDIAPPLRQYFYSFGTMPRYEGVSRLRYPVNAQNPKSATLDEREE